MSGRIETFDSRKEQTSKWSQNEAFSVREAGVDIGKSGGQGGSNVSVDQVVTSGREVAGVTVDGNRTAILVPNEGAFVQSDWNENDPSEDAYIKNKPNLAVVATSGSYDDLSDKPDLSIYISDPDYTHTDNNFTDGYKGVIDGLDTALANKVDKVAGKGLSDNNFTNAQKDKLTNLANIYGVGSNLTLDPETHILSADAQPITIDDEMSSISTNAVQNKVITEALADKVDKVTGKVLSDNNFSNSDKQKLDGIDQGAEVNDISTISVNGVNVPADANKNVNLQISSGSEYTAGDGIDISNNVISAETPIFTGTRSDWEALSLAEKQSYGQANITDDANGIVVNNIATFAKADLYSTDEKMIGRWIDGKPLYQKTFTGLNYGSTKNAWSDSGVSLTNCSDLIRVECVRSSDSANIAMSFRMNGNNIQYYAFEGFPGIDTMTVQYTKTTDSAVGIGSSNDYSTTERIVGTWIDGKPVYQKFINVSCPTSGNPCVTLDSNCEIVDFDLYYYLNDSGLSWLPCPYTATNSSRIILAVASGKNSISVTINSYATGDSHPIRGNVRYTKTTD